MTDTADLLRASLPPSVVVRRHGGLACLSVASARGSAEVFLQGAHVAAWHPAGAERPVLWTSRNSAFEPGRAIRGGVPICFPWFGPCGGDASAPMHGFARTAHWTLVDACEDADGTVALAFELAGQHVLPAWPHAFAVTSRVTLGAALTMELVVRNTGVEPFTFEEALHSYFGVGDVRDVTIAGLEGADYLDKVAGFERRRQAAEPVRFSGETDRIYLDTQTTCVVRDPQGLREIVVGKTGSDATVVWNPWIDKARAMPDFGDEEWPGMVCVETCNVNVHKRTLAPGESHAMTATIGVSHVGRPTSDGH
jgi:glucose-6-phosphate 1-epimerase